MQSLEKTYERDGLAVVAVNLDRHRADADRFLAKQAVNFDVRFDPAGQMAQAFKVKLLLAEK